MSYPIDDIEPGLFLAPRFVRASPQAFHWHHIEAECVFKVIAISAPFVAGRCVQHDDLVTFDAGTVEFERVRPDFVKLRFPEKAHKFVTRAEPPKKEWDPEDPDPRNPNRRPGPIMRIGPGGARIEG